MNTTTSKLTKIVDDPVGLDTKTGTSWYKNENNQVFYDIEGNKPATCDECGFIQKVDKLGYFYCPNNCDGEHTDEE